MISYLISYKDGEYRKRNLEYILKWLNLVRYIQEVIIIEQDSKPKLIEEELLKINDKVKYHFMKSKGMFNKSKAYNLGIDISDENSLWLAFGDNDMFIPANQLNYSTSRVSKDAMTISPYKRTYYTTEKESDRLIERNIQPRNRTAWKDSGDGTRSPFCGGIVFIKKEVFDDPDNRWDESFKGWGGEDVDMSNRLKTKYKQYTFNCGSYHLYHNEQDWN